MKTLRRKKSETISGYFYSGQTHSVTIGNRQAAVGDFVIVDEEGEPAGIFPAEYVAENFEEVAKRGRKPKEAEGVDERQSEIPGT